MPSTFISLDRLRQCSSQFGQRKTRRRWIALGAMLAYATAGGSKHVLAQTVVADAAPAGGGQTAGIAMRRWNIPGSSLDVAIAAWERATNRHVVIHIPPQTLAGFRSQGTTGIQSDEAAFRQLIAGTSLDMETNADGSIVLSVQHDTQNVQVTDNTIEPTLGLDRYPVPLIDTPQSITTVSQKTMQEQAVTTLRDALRNAPGISLAAGEGGSQGDNLTIRGFTARNDIFLDGMRDFGSYYRDPFDYSQVEVLEGPAGVAFGRGSTGGVINQETKEPELHRFTGIETLGGTDTTRRLTLDHNEPLAFLGANSGDSFRLNLMVDEGGVAERDIAFNRRYGVAPALAFGLGTPNRLTINYFRFQENDTPDYGIPWYFNKPAPVARNNYYGFQHGNYLRTDVNMFTLKAEHDFSGWATLRNQFRIANSERDVQITEPQLNTATSGLITPTTPLSQLIVNRNQIAVYSNEGFLWDQLDATVHTKFWGIRHVAVIGAEGGRETSDPVRPTFNFVNNAGTIVRNGVTIANGATVNTAPTTSLLAPNEDQLFSGVSFKASNVHVTSTSYAFYLLDTMQFGRYWEFTGGARFDRFLTNEKSIAYPTPTLGTNGIETQGAAVTTFPTRLDRKPSWRAALSFKPTGNGSIYFAYGTSFNPSAEALSLTVGPATPGNPDGTGTANLEPEFNRSYELGTKWDLMKSRLSTTAALFRTTKDNAREASPTNSLLNVLAGDQRVQGAQASVTGRITAKWQVLSSYTFMHSEVIRSEFYPLSVGSQLANVPDNLFNLWTTYQPTPKIAFGIGTSFVDSRTASSTVPNDPTTNLPKEVPGYWVGSAMGSYAISRNISFQANVINFTNNNYIDEVHPAHIIPGAGASGLFGLNFKF